MSAQFSLSLSLSLGQHLCTPTPSIVYKKRSIRNGKGNWLNLSKSQATDCPFSEDTSPFLNLLKHTVLIEEQKTCQTRSGRVKMPVNYKKMVTG